MRNRLASLILAVAAALSFTHSVVAQGSVDPGSRAWQVEVNGVTSETEVMLYDPDPSGDGTWGTWHNFDGNHTYGYGVYFWDPLEGTIEYINQSNEGGGNQTGKYQWDDGKYVRVEASHPKAPDIVLH